MHQSLAAFPAHVDQLLHISAVVIINVFTVSVEMNIYSVLDFFSQFIILKSFFFLSCAFIKVFESFLHKC